jgi:hypothetical protein
VPGAPVVNRSGKARSLKTLLVLTAIGEAATGLALLVEPPIVTRLLLGAEVAGVGLVISRVAGTALVAIAIMCWLSRNETHGKRLGLLAGVLVMTSRSLWFSPMLAGFEQLRILLWPAVVAVWPGPWCTMSGASPNEMLGQQPLGRRLWEEHRQ